MISRNGNKNFLVAHYEWLAVGAGVLALAASVVFYVLSMGESPDEAAAAEVASVFRVKGGGSAKPVEMAGYDSTLRALRTPPAVSEISDSDGSFLASLRRVFCKACKTNELAKVKFFDGDLKACPYCGTMQVEETKESLDKDGDGMPNAWEKKYGFNPDDAADAGLDKDNDGFTNLEECQANTDPTDAKDHPDYLDSLKFQLPLKETKLPFVFRKASQIPGGWRCEFFDPARKDDYGRSGRTISVKTGEKIVDVSGKEKFDYGFTLKSYEKKSVKRERKGMQGMMVEVDASEVVVERNRDGKQVTLVVQSGKNVKLAPVDVQATLVFKRGPGKIFDATPGFEFELYGVKYRVVDIKAVDKSAKVTVEAVVGGKRRDIGALE